MKEEPAANSISNADVKNAIEPATYLPIDAGRVPQEGIGMCMSGGGYRAMLFHTGTILRLNEARLLQKLDRISSVSGGSITSAVLAMNWHKLGFVEGRASRVTDELVNPIRSLASRTIDVSSVLTGTLWFGSIGEKLASSYSSYLFGDTTLQDIPDHPRFVFNATNVQSGALWRFMKPYMRDYRVGEIKHPGIGLATVVAASSAFPPFLSPVELDLNPADFTAENDGEDLRGDEFRTQVVLTDGGVYDNLGLETVWKKYKTVFVSDAGGAFQPDADPAGDWARHSYRTLQIIDNQVRAMRKRQVIGSFAAKIRKGAYWSIHDDRSVDDLKSGLNCPLAGTKELAAIGTRLKKLDADMQSRLINWGYAACDDALRRFVDRATLAADGFPYAEIGI